MTIEIPSDEIDDILSAINTFMKTKCPDIYFDITEVQVFERYG